jgi:hypothetical protein
MENSNKRSSNFNDASKLIHTISAKLFNSDDGSSSESSEKKFSNSENQKDTGSLSPTEKKIIEHFCEKVRHAKKRFRKVLRKASNAVKVATDEIISDLKGNTSMILSSSDSSLFSIQLRKKLNRKTLNALNKP